MHTPVNAYQKHLSHQHIHIHTHKQTFTYTRIIPIPGGPESSAALCGTLRCQPLSQALSLPTTPGLPTSSCSRAVSFETNAHKRACVYGTVENKQSCSNKRRFEQEQTQKRACAHTYQILIHSSTRSLFVRDGNVSINRSTQKKKKTKKNKTIKQTKKKHTHTQATHALYICINAEEQLTGRF